MYAVYAENTVLISVKAIFFGGRISYISVSKQKMKIRISTKNTICKGLFVNHVFKGLLITPLLPSYVVPLSSRHVVSVIFRLTPSSSSVINVIYEQPLTTNKKFSSLYGGQFTGYKGDNNL